MRREFDEARRAARRRDEGRARRQAPGEVVDIGDAAGVGEEGEHRRVVGAVAAEDEAGLCRVEIAAEYLRDEAAGHGELVIGSEPAIDVDRRYLGGGAFG